LQLLGYYVKFATDDKTLPFALLCRRGSATCVLPILVYIPATKKHVEFVDCLVLPELPLFNLDVKDLTINLPIVIVNRYLLALIFPKYSTQTLHGTSTGMVAYRARRHEECSV
jgi:hypothetical protein